MLLLQKENAVHVKKAEQMSPEELEGKIIVGELHRKEAPEYTAMYEKLIARARQEAGGGSVTPLKGK